MFNLHVGLSALTLWGASNGVALIKCIDSLSLKISSENLGGPPANQGELGEN